MSESTDRPLIDQNGSEFPRGLAQEKLRRTSAARDTLIEEHASAFRWLMASFLALNGGGSVAVSNLELAKQFFVGAGVSFWLGIMCALALAWRSQVINRKAIARLEKVEVVWTTALSLGRLDTLVAQEADEKFYQVSSLSAKVMSWSSVTCFSVGVWIAGAGLL